MDVSIIIVNYNTSALISNCVKSILERTENIDYEVIIVDNNSEPDFETVISSVIPDNKKKDFQFIFLPENIGFGRANNEGLKIAKGRNILFLNPDTLLINNALKILSDFLDSNQDVGACGGNVFYEDLTPSFSFWRIYPGIGESLDALFKYIPTRLIYGKNLNHNFSGRPIEVSFIIGADLMVKREILKKTGSFSKEFFMFAEETDLCYRIKEAGWKIYSVPEAKIIHLEGKSFGSSTYPSDLRIKYREEGRLKFLSLHHSRIYNFISNFLYGIVLVSRISFIKNPEKKDYFERRYKIFKSLR